MTFEEFQKELEPHKNTLVLDTCGRLARLVEAAEDESDYYYVLGYLDEPRRVWATAVGWIIYLKGNLNEEDYGRLLSMWNLNHPVPAE